MNALLVALQAADVDPQYKPEALSLLGDIAAGIGGGAYEKYMPQVQQVLTQAGHVILGQNNIEDEQHIALQQSLILTWTSLFQNFHHNPAILMENLPQILQLIIKTVQGYQNTQDAANAVYLVGYAGKGIMMLLFSYLLLGTFCSVATRPKCIYQHYLSCKTVWG